MSMRMTVAFVLIGLGAIAAGAVGMRLPSGDRIAAALPLLVGAGVGVVALAVGTRFADGSVEEQETVFLIASALGFVATIVSPALLWRRSGAGAGSG